MYFIQYVSNMYEIIKLYIENKIMGYFNIKYILILYIYIYFFLKFYNNFIKNYLYRYRTRR